MFNTGDSQYFRTNQEKNDTEWKQSSLGILGKILQEFINYSLVGMFWLLQEGKKVCPIGICTWCLPSFLLPKVIKICFEYMSLISAHGQDWKLLVIKTIDVCLCLAKRSIISWEEIGANRLYKYVAYATILNRHVANHEMLVSLYWVVYGTGI